MLIKRFALILYCSLLSWIYSGECICCIYEEYFNENISSYHLGMFGDNNLGSVPLLFKYNINTNNCPGNLSIGVKYKIFSPEIGFTGYETFYSSEMLITNESRYFTNHDMISGSSSVLNNNLQTQTLISYISQAGKLPNGKYLFHFTLQSNGDQLYTQSKLIEVQSPLGLDLLSPGGTFKELSSSYTYSTIPLFTWYADYCPNCEYAIRVCEFDQNKHESLQDALTSWSLIPMDQSQEYYPLGWNTHSYQYPSVGHIDLEVEKFYLWQIRRSIDTTLGKKHDYSVINIFEIRTPDKLQMDFSDPYLLVLKSIIGEEKFHLWFSNGGKLERFTTSGDVIWLNDEEIHIEGLYSILSELNQGKIIVKNVRIR